MKSGIFRSDKILICFDITVNVACCEINRKGNTTVAESLHRLSMQSVVTDGSIRLNPNKYNTIKICLLRTQWVDFTGNKLWKLL